MFPRLLKPPRQKSFFLFGPRGTGKTSWVLDSLEDALYLDLLESDLYLELLASPGRLEMHIPPEHKGWTIIDEVQRVPELLNEVHRLIEKRKLRFALTGSSARKLRRRGVNLLAGRALTLGMHPLTASELGREFDLRKSLRVGHLPSAYTEADPEAFLKSYVQTYLREEIQQEGLTRNLASFSRFLEAASFSQASVLNVSRVARECSVAQKAVEDYFSILEDLLLAGACPCSPGEPDADSPRIRSSSSSMSGSIGRFDPEARSILRRNSKARRWKASSSRMRGATTPL
jgi:predicted AAA+ superfamily ATPase